MQVYIIMNFWRRIYACCVTIHPEFQCLFISISPHEFTVPVSCNKCHKGSGHLGLIQQGVPVKQLQESNTSLTLNNVLCQLYTAHFHLHRCTSLHKRPSSRATDATLSALFPEGADNKAALSGCWSHIHQRKHVILTLPLRKLRLF